MNAARISATSEVALRFLSQQNPSGGGGQLRGTCDQGECLSAIPLPGGHREGLGRTGRVLQTVATDPWSWRGCRRIPGGNKGPRPKLEPSDR